MAQSAEASARTAGTGNWVSNFDEQVAQTLRHHPSVRTTQMQTVIDVASKRKDLNLSRTVEALLHIIEHDSNQKHRLMAVQVLHSIGTEHVMEHGYQHALNRLYALMETEPSAQVRGVAAITLTRFGNSG